MLTVVKRVVATGVATVLALATSVVFAEVNPAAAAIGPDKSEVVVRVAGSRNGASGQVDGVNNVWLGLYTAPKDGVLVFAAESATATQPVDAKTNGKTTDGIVRFELTENGRLDTQDYEGRPANILSGGTQLYLRPLTDDDAAALQVQPIPDKWEYLTQLATNVSTTAAKTQADAYAFPVAPAAGLQPGKPHLAGYKGNAANTTGFMTTLGTYSNGATPRPVNVTFESTGVFTVAAKNPEMPSTCKALNVGLILDTSASVTEAQQVSLKKAANQLVSAFTNTNLSLQLVTFGTEGTRQTPLTLLNPQGAANVKQAINALKPENFSGQWTNWDAAFWALQPQANGGLSTLNPGTKFDVAILLTDGLPTTFGGSYTPGSANANGNPITNGTVTGSNVYTDFFRTERAVQAANLLKQNGTHIEVLGIGDVSATQANPYNPAIINLNAVADASSVTTGSWEQAAKALRYSVLQPCLPSL